MTSNPRLAEVAAEALRREEVEVPEPSVAERAETLAAIRHALDDRARSRVLARRLGTLAVAATFLVAVGGTAWLARHPGASNPPEVAKVSPPAAASPAPLTASRVEGAVVVEGSGGATPLGAGASPGLGERVVTREGSAELALATGTRLAVERETTLAVREEDDAQIVQLGRGAVTSTVAKVKPGARFLVRAEDLEVEVRGTVFRVASDRVEGCGIASRVTVSEGRVVVREGGREHVLGAGDAWASPCADRAAASSPSSPAAPSAHHVIAAAPRSSGVAVPAPAPAPEPLPASELAAQNALFAEAMSKKAHGDVAGAVAGLDAFLVKYPASPLGEAVATQRLRLLATSDGARAKAAAKEYLARYPRGVARVEAERVLGVPDDL